MEALLLLRNNSLGGSPNLLNPIKAATSFPNCLRPNLCVLEYTLPAVVTFSVDSLLKFSFFPRQIHPKKVKDG